MMKVDRYTVVPVLKYVSREKQLGGGGLSSIPKLKRQSVTPITRRTSVSEQPIRTVLNPLPNSETLIPLPKREST